MSSPPSLSNFRRSDFEITPPPATEVEDEDDVGPPLLMVAVMVLSAISSVVVRSDVFLAAKILTFSVSPPPARSKVRRSAFESRRFPIGADGFFIEDIIEAVSFVMFSTAESSSSSIFPSLSSKDARKAFFSAVSFRAKCLATISSM
jgi:hypothetical protein